MNDERIAQLEAENAALRAALRNAVADNASLRVAIGSFRHELAELRQLTVEQHSRFQQALSAETEIAQLRGPAAGSA